MQIIASLDLKYVIEQSFYYSSFYNLIFRTYVYDCFMKEFVRKNRKKIRKLLKISEYHIQVTMLHLHYRPKILIEGAVKLLVLFGYRTPTVGRQVAAAVGIYRFRYRTPLNLSQYCHVFIAKNIIYFNIECLWRSAKERNKKHSATHRSMWTPT